MLKQQFFFGVILLVFLFYIVGKVRKKRLDLRLALGWMFITVVLMVVDAFPVIIFSLADFLGIQLPSNLIFVIGIVFLIYMVFFLTMEMSRLSRHTTNLIQELALLKETIEDVERNKSDE